ncbi:MAG: ornithine cyclodeaminase family protein [Gemmatimonadetes bacterium]|nr:ornithine cyclodeaminase family protein [Gemmatimonadota bacterium]
MALLLTRSDVAGLLDLDSCIDAVEAAFRAHGLGQLAKPGVLGVHARDGGFHVKAALFGSAGAEYFVAKTNSNFPGNPAGRGLPTIQGVIVVCDASDGRLLALIDSVEITILRTGAATAVAAKYLARGDASTATIAGCGLQGRIQLRALSRVRQLARVYAYDADAAAARRFAIEMTAQLGTDVTPVTSIADAVRASDIGITCTPSTRAFVQEADVRPGAFVAGVGADNEEKSELAPDLLASATVVTDVLEQCATIGDLHHALEAGVMTSSDVHAELGEIVAGRKPGRRSDDEIIVFDSTGVAFQDAASAARVYERALSLGIGREIRLEE